MIRVRNVCPWGALTLVGLLFLGVPMPGWPAKAGEAVYKERCGQCHPPPDPKKLTAEEWAKQMKLMAPMAELSSQERSSVLDFLQAHTRKEVKALTVADEKRVFEQKCSLCHSLDRVFLEPLTDESRRHMVFRMRERDPDWISEEEARLILDYLAKAPAEAGVAKNQVMGNGVVLFRERCSACHTLERVYLEMDEGKAISWVHVVRRMREKAPRWLTDQEAGQILQYLKSIKPVKKQ